MPTDHLLYEPGTIARIVFNNPARHNAVSLAMWQAADEAVAAAAASAETRVLIVTGAGGKAFVSGADISKFESERASAKAVEDYDAATGRLHFNLAHSHGLGLLGVTRVAALGVDVERVRPFPGFAPIRV